MMYAKFTHITHCQLLKTLKILEEISFNSLGFTVSIEMKTKKLIM